jgi:aminoglycoside 6'-N-acetyltransferase I
MEIVDLNRLKDTQREEASRILRQAISGPSYKGPGEAETETASFLGSVERFALAAVDGAAVRGWVGAVRGYSHALELHPLVVDPPWQRKGIGRALVAALEDRAVAEGYLTVHLGTDDEVGGTSLFNVDLFPNALVKLSHIKPSPAGHPFFFYRSIGYEPVGLLPDANGFGKPDIYMAKRVAIRATA